MLGKEKRDHAIRERKEVGIFGLTLNERKEYKVVSSLRSPRGMNLNLTQKIELESEKNQT